MSWCFDGISQVLCGCASILPLWLLRVMSHRYMQINVNVTFQENPYDVIQRYTRTLSWGCQVNIRKTSAAVKVDTGISYQLRRITDLLCFMVALTLFLLLIIARQQEQVIFKSVQRLRSWSLAEQPPVCKGCNCGYGPSCPINTAVHPVLNTESLADGYHLSPSSPEFAIWKQKKPWVIFSSDLWFLQSRFLLQC